jgi:NAD(P)-dependent dehydrogenase (short-subunit alcohol dehydrogenase family)
LADVKGKTVMVTGASEGLGLALALAFAEAGASVSICARRLRPLADVRKRIEACGTPCVAEPLDITDEGAVRDWIRRTERELGSPDVLINNASVLGDRTLLQTVPIAVWRETIDTNLTGTLIVTQGVLPGMLTKRSGSIVMVSSGAAIPPRQKWSAYAVSKSAVEALSLNFAEELRGTGVRVNVVDPGAMRTGMRAAAYPAEDPERLKPPTSIAPLFLWLASDDSASVTGTRIAAEQWMEDVVGR